MQCPELVKISEGRTVKMQGRTFILMANAPVLAGLLLFAFAKFGGLTDTQFNTAAINIFNVGLNKMGVSPSAYSEPTRSSAGSGGVVQLCWSPLREGLNEMCVVYTESTSELILYRVIEHPYHYETVDIDAPEVDSGYRSLPRAASDD